MKTRQRSSGSKTAQDNAQLRRENSRLRKQIQKLNGALNGLTYHGSGDDEEEDEDPPEPKKEVKPEYISKDGCQKCGNPLEEVGLGRFTYLFCTSCNHRVKKPGS